MDEEGSEKWADFTGKLACLRDEGKGVKGQVAIVLDGKVESSAPMAPEVGVRQGDHGWRDPDHHGRRGGSEAAGPRPQDRCPAADATQSEVNKISPTLGRDSLRAGLLAGGLGLGLVMIYMILYYRALGLVVWGGLLVFSALIYSLMCFLGATAGLTLSLAGVAGIIVSVGVTADSYIVAFERLKDEAQTGKSMRAAVDRGMSRAFRTILVADFVTGSAAVILFFLAVGPVKGFALTLGLSTLIDVAIAYYFTRSAVNLLARSHRFTDGRFFGIKSALGVTTT